MQCSPLQSNLYNTVLFNQENFGLLQKKYEEASQVANDAVGSIRTVASFCAEEKVMQLYQQKCEGPMNAGIREGLVGGVGYGVSFFLLFAVYATAFYAGARLVDVGQATFAEVFQVSFPSAMSTNSVTQSSVSEFADSAPLLIFCLFLIVCRFSLFSPWQLLESLNQAPSLLIQAKPRMQLLQYLRFLTVNQK